MPEYVYRNRRQRGGGGGEAGAALINAVMSGMQNRTSLDLLAMQLAAQKAEGSEDRALQREIMRDGAASRMAEIKELHDQRIAEINLQNNLSKEDRNRAYELAKAESEERITAIRNQTKALENQGVLNAAQADAMKAQSAAVLDSIRSSRRSEKLGEAQLATSVLTGRASRAGETARVAEETKLEQNAAEAENIYGTQTDIEGAIQELLDAQGGSFGVQGIGQAAPVSKLANLVTQLEADATVTGNPLKQKAAVDAARSMIPLIRAAKSESGYTLGGQPLSFFASKIFGTKSPKQESFQTFEDKFKRIATTQGVGAAAVRAARAPERAAREAASPYIGQAEDVSNKVFNLNDIINAQPELFGVQPDFVGPQQTPDSNNEQVHTPVSFGQPQTSLYNLPEIIEAANYMSRNALMREGLIA